MSTTAQAGAALGHVWTVPAVAATAQPMPSIPRTNYAAADASAQALWGWYPTLRSSDAEWLGERDVSVARIRDLERNEGWVSAGIDRQVDMLVGAALRLNSKPDADALGISADEAHALGRAIQSQWNAWANDPTFRCDSERQMPFAGLAGLVAREFVTIGEGLTVLRWIDRPGWPYRTAVQVVDPDRLSNPDGQPDTATMRRGVEKHAVTNEPVAYHIRRAHPNDLLLDPSGEAFVWDRFPRWDRLGDWERPKVLHVYDKRRPGQSRGVSRLVGALLKMRMLSRYSESEVKTAAINATIVGAIYTQLGADYAAERLGDDGAGRLNWDQFTEQRAGFYEKSRRVMDDSRFLTLFPTDRLDLNTQPRQTAGYPAFQTAFLQAFAAALGVSYEQLSMDWSRTNYSSARAALNEVWRGVMRLRAILIWSFAVPVFAAWLEEALDLGAVPAPAAAPDFHDAPHAWLRSDWIGPGRGYIDPVKEAQAAQLRMDNDTSTLERENAEQGLDWEMTLEQKARERAERERLGLPAGRTDLAILPRSDLPDDRANRG